MNNINETFEKTIVVGVNTGNDELFNYQFNETCSLCEALSIEVVDTLVQNLPHFNTATYLGKGKLEELESNLKGKKCWKTEKPIKDNAKRKPSKLER